MGNSVACSVKVYAPHYCSLNGLEGALLGLLAWRIVTCLYVCAREYVCVQRLPSISHSLFSQFISSAWCLFSRSRPSNNSPLSGDIWAVTSLCCYARVRAVTIVFWQPIPRRVLSLALIATLVFWAAKYAKQQQGGCFYVRTCGHGICAYLLIIVYLSCQVNDK